MDHHEVPSFKEEYSQEVAKLQSYSVKDLLSILMSEYGMTRLTAAGLIGSKRSVLTRFPLEEHLNRTHADNLVNLTAYMRLVENHVHLDPAKWFNTPMVDGYFFMPAHLYPVLTDDERLSLLESSDIRTFLDTAVPEWSTEYRTDFTVQTMGNGESVIVLKSEIS